MPAATLILNGPARVMLSRWIGEARRQGERDLTRAATALRGILRDRGARVDRFVARLTPVMLSRRIGEARRHGERDLARAQAALRAVVRGRRAAFARSAARLTAEPMHRDERAQLLGRTSRDGYADNYSGIRISATGRRFRIHQAIVWNLVDSEGRRVGQAAEVVGAALLLASDAGSYITGQTIFVDGGRVSTVS